MRTLLLTSIAGAALLAAGGLAAAQMETSPGHITGAPREGSMSMQHEPGPMQSPTQRSAEPMQGMTQGRSNAVDRQGPRSPEDMN